MDLTPEERAELVTLEKDETDRRKSMQAARQRQHLEALRMSKRLAAKHGTPGVDFLVAETVLGNVAIRRPTDLEVDADHGDLALRENLEKFLLPLILEPPQADVQKMFADNPFIVTGLAGILTKLQAGMIEEDAKK